MMPRVQMRVNGAIRMTICRGFLAMVWFKVIAFYFGSRNQKPTVGPSDSGKGHRVRFQVSEVGGQRSDDGWQRTDDRFRIADLGFKSKETGDRSQESGVRRG